MTALEPPVLVAALAAAGAVALRVAPTPRPDPPGALVAPRPGSRSGTRRAAVRALLAASVVAAAGVTVGPVVAVWVLLAGGLVAGARSLLARRAAAREAVRRRGEVLAACDLLAADLRAGRPPYLALRSAAREWPELAPVLRAEALGADVVAAWRSVAALPGAGDLSLVAAAWRVSERTGSALAEALTRVAGLARSAESTRRTVASELASARATARLMAGLPVVALLIGGTTGGDPVAFLLRTPVGLGCLAGGLALGWLGLWWIERIADDVGGAS